MRHLKAGRKFKRSPSHRRMMLRNLATGTPFLERSTAPCRVWYVSEESHAHWAERLEVLPIGGRVELLSRPFDGRPTAAEWERLIDRAAEASAEEPIGLFVVDPIASFLPGRCESDAATLLESLGPLHRLTSRKTCVLLLHHPRKKPADEGQSARGSGALLGFVDTSLELRRIDAEHRLLLAQGRNRGAPGRLTYSWDPETGDFAVATDPRDRPFEESWLTIRAILDGLAEGLTQREIAEAWPAVASKPVVSTIYEWLNRAHSRRLVQRAGRGVRTEPWRYRLKPAEASG